MDNSNFITTTDENEKKKKQTRKANTKTLYTQTVKRKKLVKQINISDLQIKGEKKSGQSAMVINYLSSGY